MGLTVHLKGTVENLELVVTNSAGEIVGQVAAPTTGDYVFDELTDGSYIVRAVVGDTVVASVTNERRSWLSRNASPARLLSVMSV